VVAQGGPSAPLQSLAFSGRYDLVVALLHAPGLVAVPDLAHAFTTRAGGVSAAPFESLNLGRRPGESEAALLENWERVARALDPGLSAGDVVLIDQVHGAEVAVVDRAAGPLTFAAKADAVLTTRPGVLLAARVADCVPAVLAVLDASGRPLGVAAVHSGWRGTARDVAGAAARALLRLGGAVTLLAAVGPCIGPTAFEVGDEVVAALAADLDPTLFLVATPPGRSRPHVDLGAAVAAQLARAGARVERVQGCTVTDPRFFSHRRAPGGGHQAGVIALRG
jgi:YfiH family protein